MAIVRRPYPIAGSRAMRALRAEGIAQMFRPQLQRNYIPQSATLQGIGNYEFALGAINLKGPNAFGTQPVLQSTTATQPKPKTATVLPGSTLSSPGGGISSMLPKAITQPKTTANIFVPTTTIGKSVDIIASRPLDAVSINAATEVQAQQIAAAEQSAAVLRMQEQLAQLTNPLAQTPTFNGGAPGAPCFGGTATNPFTGVVGENGFCFPVGTPGAVQGTKAAASKGSSLATSPGTDNTLAPKSYDDETAIDTTILEAGAGGGVPVWVYGVLGAGALFYLLRKKGK